MRSHPAGTLRAEHAGQTVTLAGWVARRRDHGGVIFIDLRDASGTAQVVFREGEMAERAHRLRAEFCVQVVGEVVVRPEGNENPDLPTGAIEVTATALTVLSESAPLPFPVDEHAEVGEEVRLKHRYLDLRRSGPAAAMRLRSEVNRAAREVLHEREFVEVETPTLTRSTPEGARDFLVPARLRPGSWYALPQSPQLFKQLLMVGGLERYFQIARCYRDEDFRADRQPEFTQLDIEMSFVEQDDVIELAEAVLAALWALVGYEVPRPIRRMTYAEAMSRYGSDKPDLRFGIELTELTAYFARDRFPRVPEPLRRRRRDAGRCEPGPSAARRLAGVGQAARRPRPGLRAGRRGRRARRAGPGRQEPLRCGAGRARRCRRRPSRATASSSRRARRTTPVRCSAPPAGRSPAARGLLDESAWSFVWIVDAPMFEAVSETDDIAVGHGQWTALHHAFTSPNADWIDNFDDDPGNALAYAYDIVCNGNEIGGGSIRIHRARRAEAGLRGDGPRRGGGPGEVRLPARRVRLRPAPARRHRVRLGPDHGAARRAPTPSARSSRSRRPAAATTRSTAAPAPITAEQRKEAGVDAKPPAKPAL